MKQKGWPLKLEVSLSVGMLNVMVPCVKDNNHLGTQKTVSLDFDE